MNKSIGDEIADELRDCVIAGTKEWVSQQKNLVHHTGPNIEIASLIKGMLKRGDRQSDIAACFLINGGRVAEINKGRRFQEVPEASADSLPPAGPYPSPYELWKARNGLWATRVVLEAVAETLEKAIAAVKNAEGRTI